MINIFKDCAKEGKIRLEDDDEAVAFDALCESCDVVADAEPEDGDGGCFLEVDAIREALGFNEGLALACEGSAGVNGGEGVFVVGRDEVNIIGRRSLADQGSDMGRRT